MKKSELYEIRKKYFHTYWKYKLILWDKFNYDKLSNIMYLKRSGRNENDTYNDCIIMIDTETSKKDSKNPAPNHVCAFTVTIRAFDMNIVTLFGHRPDELIDCMDLIHENMQGLHTIFYCHNYPYDYVFCRKFMFAKWGTPEKVLNVKPHYPILMIFKNGIILKDSLILSQKSLERWANDLDVEHKKAIGKWDYDLIRNQDYQFNKNEREYIEHDTLAGVECIQKTMDALGKRIYSIPFTATGIPREQVQKIGKEYQAHEMFQKLSPNYLVYKIFEAAFHGGYVHGNRYYINELIEGLIDAYDFASSYPFCILAEKFPMSAWEEWRDCSIDEILSSADNYAFVCKLILHDFELKDKFNPMPALQFSKMINPINCILDNGRVLKGSYAEIYLTSADLRVIKSQYQAAHHICVEVYCSRLDYLPRWFTDYVYSLFQAKTYLKCGDPVEYSLSKAKLNSCYGMMVQKAIQEDIQEDYLTGEYKVEHDEEFTFTEEEMKLYMKYINNHNKVLPYCWGIFVTSYAFEHLFELGACAGTWLYSDTDSCYGQNWDMKKLEAYNNKCKDKLRANGYGPVIRNDREYWLGIAEHDGSYSEFKMMGAKRYAGRSIDDGEIHITVAGVPKKKGALCLDNDLNNFAPGFIFHGTKTGKRQHTYFYADDIYTDENGNITGDSIDLNPCDYLLDMVRIDDFDAIMTDEIEVIDYEQKEE